ncbi:MAG: TfoX/Sxy family protein [Acidobacteriaceae bacterium]|nr:TfoX/Sxy family protein [Acidobacteriaceae bacterium]
MRTALHRESVPFEEKKMFGGTAFMVRGKMCVAVGQERLMCRIDPAVHDQALQHEGCRTVVMRGRNYIGYVHVDTQVLSQERQMNYWIGLALDYNRVAPESKRKKS